MLRARIRGLAALAVVIPAVALPASAGATTLFGSGSSAEQPILNVLFRAYNRAHHEHQVQLPARRRQRRRAGRAGGSARCSRSTPVPPLPSDAGTTYFKLFLDGLCVDVNPQNSLSNLTDHPDARTSSPGVFTNWSQVGGSNLSTTIDPVGRNSTAGSVHVLPAGRARRPDAVLERRRRRPPTDSSRRTVSKDPNAIGYVGLAHSGKGSGVKTLELNGVACNQADDQERELPPVPLDLGRPARRISAEPHRSRSSSTGSGPASRPARSSTAPARWPLSTRSSEEPAEGDGRGRLPRAEPGHRARTSAPSFGSARLCSWWSACCWRCSRSSSTRRGRRSPTTGSPGSAPGAASTSRSTRSSPSGDLKEAPVYTFHAWPLIWSTILITVGAVAIAFVCLAVHRGVHRGVRPDLAAAGPRAGGPAAGERAVGDLRAGAACS